MILKVRFETKSTTQWVGYFETISGHFFGNYINFSHKTEVVIVILMCLTCWNPYSIKRYNMKHNFCYFCFFNFVRKKKWKITTHKWLFYDHFWPFLANYLDNFHKTEVLMVISRCLVCLVHNWIKSNNMVLVKIYFCHAWKYIISGLIHRSEFWQLWGIKLSYFQNGYFAKILWGFHETHNQVKCR